VLLAIDTSAGTSVAVVAAGRVLAHADEPGTRRHAEAIGILLRQVLREAGVTPAIASHDAIAYGHAERVLVVTDARRREVAWSVYDPEVTRLEGPELCERDGFDVIEAAHPGVTVLAPPTVSAASLGLVAELLLTAGRPLGPEEPLYLRPPDAIPRAVAP